MTFSIKHIVIVIVSVLLMAPSALPSAQKHKPKQAKRAAQAQSRPKTTTAKYGQYDFSLLMLDGTTRRLSDFGGKAVLVFFFAPDCDPCSLQAARMSEMYTKYKSDGFEILGVAIHVGETGVRSFVDAASIGWPVGMRNDVVETFGAYGLPDSWLFLPDGSLLRHFIGYTRPEMIEPFLKQALRPLKNNPR